MVKKSRRQKGGTGRVDYSVVDQVISGQNTDSVETSVASTESSSTMSQPKTSKKSRAILRSQTKSSQYNGSKLEEGSADRDIGRSSPHPHSSTMHAVANGERMEAFKNGECETTNGQRETINCEHDSADGVNIPLVETVVHASKYSVHDRPCPRSKKSRNSTDGGNSSETQEWSQATEPEPALDVAEPTDAGVEVPGHRDTGEKMPETQAAVEVAEDNVQEEKNEADDSGVAQEDEEEAEQYVNGVTDECTVGDSSAEPSVNGNEESEIPNAGSEHGSEESKHGNTGGELWREGSEHDNEGSEHGNEGIVTEPEDHANQEACSVSDPDVTISFLDGEAEGEGSSEPDQVEDPPLVEFPADSPGKIPLSPQDPSDTEDSDVDVVVQNLLDSDDPMTDSQDTSLETDYKVLHRHHNPARTAQQDGDGDKDGKPNFSYGRSLRSVSGRQSMKLRRQEEPEVPTTTTKRLFNFGFGKRKAEEVEEGEGQGGKRPKPEEGVDAMGLFARLTSPVINRLRSIRVGSPFRPEAEATGHEEMAVAILPVAQSPSSRCVLM